MIEVELEDESINNKDKRESQNSQREQTIKSKNKLIFSNNRRTASEIIEENIGGIEDSTKKLIKQGEKIDKIYCLDKIPINVLRIITILMIMLFIIAAILGIIFYIIKKETNPFLYCFNYILREDGDEKEKKIEDKDIILFLADLISFYIIHAIFLFIFICILVTLFKNQENDVKNFFKDVSIFLSLTLLGNIVIFILGILCNFYDNEFWEMNCYIIFSGLGTVFMFKIYIKTKKNKYKNIMRLINQGILSGVMASFELYCLLYNIFYLLIGRTKIKDYNNLELIPGSLFFIISFIFILFYKDIIFPITSLILEIGLLYTKKSDALAVVIFNICAVFLNFSSIIVTIFKYNKKVFKLVGNNEDELLY